MMTSSTFVLRCKTGSREGGEVWFDFEPPHATYGIAMDRMAEAVRSYDNAEFMVVARFEVVLSTARSENLRS